ncbi:MAG: hypothetical protein CFH41_00705 [Alphaproteobacteria bacterium MarineAlpha11_Bin1]|nr:MAG: hypothetical protein CFH41_00705 [Alphaproteobacteria bacterium MarineAlpha11_Bin1]|tara:strand:+ start:2697 stop:2987 length:291 start_codon:yes stop_codon:yes gene_type:complete
MPKGYIIGHLNIQNMEAFRVGYASKVGDLVSEVGGKFLVRGGNVAYREGDKADLDVVAEFPDIGTAEAFLASDSYKAIEPARKENTTGLFKLVEGV